MTAPARMAAAVLASCSLLWHAAPAPAADHKRRPPDPNELVTPATLDRPPPGRERSAEEVMALADREPKVRATRRHHPGATRYAYLKGPKRWQVSYFARQRPGRGPARQEIAQVLLDDRSGRVLEAWTGHQVAWTMARGYPGAFGRRAAALYVWIPLSLLFVLPFVDRRRLRSLRNLDLLALLSFSVSLAFFSHGEIGVSVPLAYPPMVYLLLRMLLAARARARRAGGDEQDEDGPRPLRLLVPTSWLLVALIFLVGFRIGLNVLNSNVIDVGYAGVIGASRLIEGEPLYGNFPSDNENGDTYGPVVYYAYMPFERAWPWSGSWDDLPAAHAASVAFDLLTMLLLWLLGRRVRGPSLGVALAYAWAAYPFTLFTASSNSNDSLVAALVVAALLAASSPLARGYVAALAGLTKFAPLALTPLLALYGTRDGAPSRPSVRQVALFAAAFAVTAAVLMVPVVIDGSLRLFYERTIAYQRDRSSPFSVWGLVEQLGGAQAAVQIGAVALALVVAFVPRRRDVVTLAALAGAVLIAVQLGVSHWFYLYIVWFFPPVMLVMLAEDVPLRWRDRPSPDPEPESARSRPPASVAMR